MGDAVRRYLVVQLTWLSGHSRSVYLDVAIVTDTRSAAVAFAEAHGGYVLEADWWPAPTAMPAGDGGGG